MKKVLQTHDKDQNKGRIWQAARLEAVVRSKGIKPIRKPKKDPK